MPRSHRLRSQRTMPQEGHPRPGDHYPATISHGTAVLEFVPSPGSGSLSGASREAVAASRAFASAGSGRGTGTCQSSEVV